MRAGFLDRVPERQRQLLRHAPRARSTGPPMLAVLSDRRAFDDGWLFERKLDGVRALARRDTDKVRLTSRSGKPLNATYPELVDALAAQDCEDFTVDGEIVALSHGRTDFSLLQQRMGLTDPAAVRASRVAVHYYLFDLLRLDGYDITGLPLRTRKALLRDALEFRAPLRFTPHRNQGGQDLLDQACARDWEGLIAKRAGDAYVRKRSTSWLKLKCSAGQEFVIGGFTEPAGSRVGFGALLVGYYQDGRLRYAGKVGTGYDTATLVELRRRLDGLVRSRCPFVDEVGERTAHWVRPRLVGQFDFTEWTRAGRLRHPRFLGLRDDKHATDVIRERPAGGTS
ncbi:putative ATP-dependent DNA ligase [Streptomyces sp. NBRC 110611]|uniref:non-homologous end-joining DNA ligase n=1 Tax=Streptomyces sp. NBRC 110611 TaxID=1621259 RepID=UPI00083791DE|nr:non-homologous end-joining DNA ligase [Streptomyces sp. NBRC 110611]GAU69328.1 putative ATP-dependent DNA ligase [Streptomyces sp. NBRC 110611]